MAKLLKSSDKVAVVSNFLDSLDLTPRILITKEVVDLIWQSWQREFQREDLAKQKKQQMQDLINRLSARKRKPKPILDNMIPLNFQPLYENVSTAFNEADSV